MCCLFKCCYFFTLLGGSTSLIVPPPSLPLSLPPPSPSPPSLFLPISLPQDVFTVSVGNLPPGASVLIKITYVAELVVEGENIVFSLPGNVAPWKQETTLDQTTQTDVKTTKVKKQRYVYFRSLPDTIYYE